MRIRLGSSAARSAAGPRWSWLRWLAATALVALASTGCGSDPLTQVVVRIEADPGIRQQATMVRVRVWGAPAGGELDQRLVRILGESGPVPWPIQMPLAPLRGDASRTFQVEAVALDDEGAPVTRARARSGYVEGDSRLLVLTLTRACQDVECPMDETCAGGECLDAFQAPESLPPYVPGRPDASVGDGGRHDGASMDGGLVDASVTDAGISDGSTDARAMDAALDGGGMNDGGRGDGAMDGGRQLDSGADGRASDAGRSDAGRSDAGRSDAGRSDAGRSDAGRDAGVPSCATIGAGDLVITEVMPASEGGDDDGGEWFEVHNPRACRADLTGVVISSPTGGGSERAERVSAGSIDAFGYFVFVLNPDRDRNHRLPFDYAYGSVTSPTNGDVILNNGGDRLALEINDTTIDQVQYAADAFTVGRSRQFPPGTDADGNDVWTAGCDATTAYATDGATSYYGTPRQENRACP
jgi:hypothetical protein